MFLVSLAVIAALASSPTPLSAQTIPAAHVYHNHMPNFWPFYAMDPVSQYNATAIGAPIRYMADGDVINLKNNPPAGYTYYNPGGAGIMPHDDLVTYYSANAKYQCYQSFPPNMSGAGWPMATAELMQSYAGGNGQVHVNMSGALVNDVNSIELLNNISGLYNEGSTWNSQWVKDYTTLFTKNGYPTLDLVHFTSHHSLGPLVGNDFLLKELIVHGATLAQSYFLGGTHYVSSYGFFPTELSFSERMIPALTKMGIQWTVLGNNHYSHTLQDYPYATYDARGDASDSPPNRGDLRNTSNVGSWVSAVLQNQSVSLVDKYPFASTPHWIRYIDPSTGAISQMAGIPVSLIGSWAEGYNGQVTVDEYLPYASLEPRQFFVIAHDGDNSSGRSGSEDTWMNGVTITGSGSGYNLGIDEYLKKFPIPSTDVQHVQDGSWADVLDASTDPMFYHWHLPPLIWSGQFAAYNSATGSNLAPKKNLQGIAEGATVTLEDGWHYQERNYALFMCPLNYAKTAEQIWLDAHPNYWSPSTALDRQVTYAGNQLNPWMLAAPVKGDPNNDYRGGANPAELAWYFLLPGMDSGFGYYGENVDDDVKGTLAYNNSLAFSKPYVTANLAQDRTGPSVWVPQRYPYNPGSVNGSKAEGWTVQWYNNHWAVYTYAYDVSGISSVQLMVRAHTISTISNSDDTYKVFNPSALVGTPGLNITPSNVTAWTAYPMSMRDLHPVMNGVSWIPSDQATMAVLPAQDTGNLYYAYLNQFRSQYVDYYVQATDAKGNVTNSDIQTVYVGAGTYSTGGLSGYTEDPNGTVQGTDPFITAGSANLTATPTFSPAGGTYLGAQSVTISDATTGASIYYTTNGTNPTTASTLYTGPIAVSAGTVTIKAIATASGMSQSNIGSATYSISSGGGTLTGSGSAVKATTSVNLTTQGTSDWAHWGQASASAFDHKGSGGSQISPITVVGAGTPGQFIDSIQQMTWTDGAPTASATNSPNGIWLSGNGNGFSFTVPADTTQRTVTIYLGGYKSGGKLTAHLSDVSALDYSDSSMSAATTGTDGVHYYAMYSLTYKAASAGQTLQISWVQSSDAGGGNVTFQAVALSGGTSTPAATPTFSPAGGTYTTAQSVTIADATTGATIYYTTDGTTPTTASTKYVNAITVNASETLKAIATAAGFTQSDVGVATYTIGGGSLTGSGTAVKATSTVNLTTQGTSDWAHWGQTSATAFDHKSTGGSQISGMTPIGTGTSGQFVDSIQQMTWTDGTPTASATNSPNGIWIAGTGNGFSFTAPADSNQRTLTVYVGGYKSGGTFTAHLSDNSSADYKDSSMSGSATGTDGSHYYAMYTITYKAASASQTIKITWVQAADAGGGNVTLQAAALSGGTLAPAATPTFSPAPGSYPAAQSVTISDATSGATIYYTTDGTTPTTASTVYTFPLTVSTNQTIKAIATATGFAQSDVGSASYTIGGGVLSGTGTAVKTTTTINLTTQGTSDWAHWGQSTATSFDHKSTGGSQISNVTVVGTGSLGQFIDSIQQMTWTDGTPTASATGSKNGIWIAGNGNGLSFTVPADTTQRTVTVYVGGYKSGAKLTAHLSDNSAADYTDNSMSAAGTGTDGSHYYATYTLTYRAASAGQTLKLSWVQSSDAGGGNVTLQAATK